MISSLLQQAQEHNEIRPLDHYLGLFLEGLADKDHPELRLAGTLTSMAVGKGHICFPLGRAQELLPQISSSQLPDMTGWRNNLLATPVVGQPGETAPLILDHTNRLYMYRFFKYEQHIAEDLLKRAKQIRSIDIQQLKKLQNRLFPDQEGDDQQLAAIIAQLKSFVVISGGPGTGKTYTMARLLALATPLAETPLQIRMAAPTGKAAARMEEAIRKAKQQLPSELAHAIPEQAETLHRLLGYRPGKHGFRYDRENQLRLDLLVVDEASMIDVPMMDALLQALPHTSRLILLGDRNQLASVEAGSLFSDLCNKTSTTVSPPLFDLIQTVTPTPGLQKKKSIPVMADSVVFLRTSYRFQKTSGIGKLATAVNNGDSAKIEQILDSQLPDVINEQSTGKKRENWLRIQIIQQFQPIFQAPDVDHAFAAMEQFRFLCALRQGTAGVENINALVEKTLRHQGLITTDAPQYPGRPIIIRRNHYGMQLFNGDSGLLFNDHKGRLRAWFRHPDNTLYPVTPARLPEHDTAYAITIHKAQGSEFEQVLLLLPEEESLVLSRELIYTGITRTRSQLVLCSTRKILDYAIKKRTRRYSGLAEKLWPKTPLAKR